MGELWKLLDSAQNNESGIPQEMIDKKKEEIKNRRVWLYIHWGWANVVKMCLNQIRHRMKEHTYNSYRKQKIELAEWMKVWRNYQMRMTQLDAKEVIEVVLVAEDHVLDLVIVIDEQEAAQEIGKH